VKLQPVALALLVLAALLVIATTVLSATGNLIPSWFEALAFASLTAGAGVTIPNIGTAPAAVPAPAPAPPVAPAAAPVVLGTP